MPRRPVHSSSPIHRTPLIREKEDNYFFRLSAFQDDLVKLFDEQPVLDLSRGGAVLTGRGHFALGGAIFGDRDEGVAVVERFGHGQV